MEALKLLICVALKIIVFLSLVKADRKIECNGRDFECEGSNRYISCEYLPDGKKLFTPNLCPSGTYCNDGNTPLQPCDSKTVPNITLSTRATATADPATTLREPATLPYVKSTVAPIAIITNNVTYSKTNSITDLQLTEKNAQQNYSLENRSPIAEQKSINESSIDTIDVDFDVKFSSNDTSIDNASTNITTMVNVESPSTIKTSAMVTLYGINRSNVPNSTVLSNLNQTASPNQADTNTAISGDTKGDDMAPKSKFVISTSMHAVLRTSEVRTDSVVSVSSRNSQSFISSHSAVSINMGTGFAGSASNDMTITTNTTLLFGASISKQLGEADEKAGGLTIENHSNIVTSDSKSTPGWNNDTSKGTIVEDIIPTPSIAAKIVDNATIPEEISQNFSSNPIWDIEVDKIVQSASANDSNVRDDIEAPQDLANSSNLMSESQIILYYTTILSTIFKFSSNKTTRVPPSNSTSYFNEKVDASKQSTKVPIIPLNFPQRSSELPVDGSLGDVIVGPLTSTTISNQNSEIHRINPAEIESETTQTTEIPSTLIETDETNASTPTNSRSLNLTGENDKIYETTQFSSTPSQSSKQPKEADDSLNSTSLPIKTGDIISTSPELVAENSSSKIKNSPILPLLLNQNEEISTVSVGIGESPTVVHSDSDIISFPTPESYGTQNVSAAVERELNITEVEPGSDGNTGGLEETVFSPTLNRSNVVADTLHSAVEMSSNLQTSNTSAVLSNDKAGESIHQSTNIDNSTIGAESTNVEIVNLDSDSSPKTYALDRSLRTIPRIEGVDIVESEINKTTEISTFKSVVATLPTVLGELDLVSKADEAMDSKISPVPNSTISTLASKDAKYEIDTEGIPAISFKSETVAPIVTSSEKEVGRENVTKWQVESVLENKKVVGDQIEASPNSAREAAALPTNITEDNANSANINVDAVETTILEEGAEGTYGISSTTEITIPEETSATTLLEGSFSSSVASTIFEKAVTTHIDEDAGRSITKAVDIDATTISTTISTIGSIPQTPEVSLSTLHPELRAEDKEEAMDTKSGLADSAGREKPEGPGTVTSNLSSVAVSNVALEEAQFHENESIVPINLSGHGTQSTGSEIGASTNTVLVAILNQAALETSQNATVVDLQIGNTKSNSSIPLEAENQAPTVKPESTTSDAAAESPVIVKDIPEILSTTSSGHQSTEVNINKPVESFHKQTEEFTVSPNWPSLNDMKTHPSNSETVYTVHGPNMSYNQSAAPKVNDLIEVPIHDPVIVQSTSSTSLPDDQGADALQHDVNETSPTTAPDIQITAAPTSEIVEVTTLDPIPFEVGRISGRALEPSVLSALLPIISPQVNTSVHNSEGTTGQEAESTGFSLDPEEPTSSNSTLVSSDISANVSEKAYDSNKTATATEYSNQFGFPKSDAIGEESSKIADSVPTVQSTLSTDKENPNSRIELIGVEVREGKAIGIEPNTNPSSSLPQAVIETEVKPAVEVLTFNHYSSIQSHSNHTTDMETLKSPKEVSLDSSIDRAAIIQSSRQEPIISVQIAHSTEIVPDVVTELNSETSSPAARNNKTSSSYLDDGFATKAMDIGLAVTTESPIPEVGHEILISTQPPENSSTAKVTGPSDLGVSEISTISPQREETVAIVPINVRKEPISIQSNPINVSAQELSVTNTPIKPKEDFSCRSHGVFPSETNCRQYFLCIEQPFGYVKISKLCSPRNAFDYDTQRCVSDVSSCYESKCVNEGNFPDPLDDTSYFSCSKNSSDIFQKYHLQCSPPKRFIPVTGICDDVVKMVVGSSIERTTQASTTEGIANNIVEHETSTMSSSAYQERFPTTVLIELDYREIAAVTNNYETAFIESFPVGSSKILQPPTENQKIIIRVARQALPIDPTQFECSKPGIFAHELNCTEYYVCVRQNSNKLTKITATCPPRYAYNPEKQKCTRDLGKCIDQPCARVGNFANTFDESSYFRCMQNAGGGYRKYQVKCQFPMKYVSDKDICTDGVKQESVVKFSTRRMDKPLLKEIPLYHGKNISRRATFELNERQKTDSGAEIETQQKYTEISTDEKQRRRAEKRLRKIVERMRIEAVERDEAAEERRLEHEKDVRKRRRLYMISEEGVGSQDRRDPEVKGE